jgi:serine/threonine protein kinase
MEYASGGSLYDQLKLYRKLPEKQVKRYICDITEALEYLHSKDCPILHRDIKPENLLIDGEGNCKLADFGSSNKMDGVRKSYVGTPEYMPPEIAEFKPHGIKADLWNLGMLIYELLTGNTPNPANMLEIDYPAFLSRSAEDLIKKLLVADPVKRISIS